MFPELSDGKLAARIVVGQHVMQMFASKTMVRKRMMLDKMDIAWPLRKLLMAFGVTEKG